MSVYLKSRSFIASVTVLYNVMIISK